MVLRCSRRRALQLLGSAGIATAMAGCSGPGSLDQLSLIGSELPVSSIEGLDQREYFWEDPVDIPATTQVDFTDGTKEQYVSELFDTGSVTAQQWPLVWRSPWGTTTVPRPTFLERDGAYYQVRITDERQLERKRWHFALQRVEESPPSSATVAETPVDASAQDKRVIDAALSAVYAGSDGFLGEPDFAELQTVEYHQGLDAEASDLIPSPPFEYIKPQHSEEYYRPVTEQQVVSVPEWKYAISEVGSSASELTAYARNEIVDTELNGDLSRPANDIIDDAISEEDPRRYGESAPPSDALIEVLTQLDIASDLQPVEEYPERVDFKDVVAIYNNTVYSFDLIVSP